MAKTKKEVKVALIGAGAMANGVHYPSVAAFKDVKIVGISDLFADKLEATAKRFDIKNTFSDYRVMLEKTKPDAVYALMPPHDLFNVAIDVLDRGFNLLVEKPPAVTSFQTRCLAKMATDRKVITAVGFQRRFHPLIAKCHSVVRKTGPVQQCISCFYKYLPPAEKYPYYNGAIDVLSCDAVHAVDSLRYYTGLSEVKAVASDIRCLDSWYPVSFNALVYFENDAVGILQLNWRTGRRIFKFEFHSTSASAYADTDTEGTVYANGSLDPVYKAANTEVAGSKDMHIVQGYYAQSRAFIDAVKTGKQGHNSMQDAVKTMELVDRIYASAINK